MKHSGFSGLTAAFVSFGRRDDSVAFDIPCFDVNISKERCSPKSIATLLGEIKGCYDRDLIPCQKDCGPTFTSAVTS